MKLRRMLFWVGCCLFSGGLTLLAQPTPEFFVEGVVVDEAGYRVAGALVRAQATAYAAHADIQGQFRLILPDGSRYALTAWANGYFNAPPVEVTAGQTDVRLVLQAHDDADHPGYVWVSAFSTAGDPLNCENCHSAAPDEATYPLPFDEWRRDAHATSTLNERFLSMYTGTDVEGRTSPITEFVFDRDYGRIPLAPDRDQPYYGPGYLLDFPNSTGNCAACHAPLAAVNAPYEANPLTAEGVLSEGVSCDFCHKVWAVTLDPATDLPYANMPGVLSYRLLRPAEGHQFFAGPFDDVAPGEDTYSPLQQDSAFCAGCHYGVFWDTVIYNSYGEWLESAYSDPQTGQTCQDCHMPPGQSDYFARTEVGGLQRDPQTIYSHSMPGALDQTLLQNTAEVTLHSTQQGALLTVTVRVRNTGAGHHMPTDSPLRHMLLFVDAAADGRPLRLIEGSHLPDWAGADAGRAGRYYARLLEQAWTGEFPTGAYWMPVRVREDTRLPALASDESTYVFRVPPGSATVTVDVQLVLRRAFAALMAEKGWDMPDIIMETVSETVTP